MHFAISAFINCVCTFVHNVAALAAYNVMFLSCSVVRSRCYCYLSGLQLGYAAAPYFLLE